MARARVTTGARLHFGFQNLSLARDRLYGGIGVALDAPRIAIEAEPAQGIEADDPVVERAAERASAVLGVAGARVRIETTYRRHVGLGSGTQLALATYAAIARAHDRSPAVRDHAPALGRGGRSGIGVGAFEAGGFLVDIGHPTERFTTAPPADGNWTVPRVGIRHSVPENWRFLVVTPAIEQGASGDTEDEGMREVVERADPTIADEIARVLTQRLVPAVAAGNRERFGRAVEAIGRFNGAWYANEQGGTYRPPLGELIEFLRSSPAIAGVGQSSWGPTVYGVTSVAGEAKAKEAARAALDTIDVEGTISTRRPANEGARVES